MATEGGVPQAMYPEGGLTTDGRLREPKLGLLDYMLKGFDPRGERDLVFIPVGINYDRVLEDRSLLREARSAARRRRRCGASSRSWRVSLAPVDPAPCSARRYRHGYACVNFGTPVSMRAHVAAQASTSAPSTTPAARSRSPRSARC